MIRDVNASSWHDRVRTLIIKFLVLTVSFFILQVIICYYNQRALVKSSTSFMSDSLKLHFC